MKRTSQYASMKASDLARVTRERGLEKPKVITLSEWADFLEADDAKRDKKAQAKESARVDNADTEPVERSAQKTTTDDKADVSTLKPKKASQS